MNELKPCPFCGGEAYEKYRDVVNCKNDNCFIQYTDFDIEGWNTRAIDPRLKKTVDELENWMGEIQERREKKLDEEDLSICYLDGQLAGLAGALYYLEEYVPELKEKK